MTGDWSIVYFGNDWFAENRTSSHHIARRLARRFPLLYVESPGLRAPKASGRDLRKLGRKLARATRLAQPLGDGMWHMTAPQIPFRRLPLVEPANRILSGALIRRAMRHLGFRQSISWFVVPHMAPVAGVLGERFTVYYCIDDYASLPDVDRQAVQRLDESMARKADQVFVSSRVLERKQSRRNPQTCYSPHGVDVELFGQAMQSDRAAAGGLGDLPRPVIGFFGLLEAWIDLDLLLYLARSRPQWSFVLVGRVAVDPGELGRLPNVHTPGPQPYETLPDWARGFDVCIYPGGDNEFVRNANPLKIREYLATGRPVVSVSTPEVDQLEGPVRIARGREDFLRQIESALAEETAQKRQERLQAVAAMSWDARLERVLEVVRAGLEKKGYPDALA